MSHSDSAGGGTTDFRAEQTSQQPPVAAAQCRTASTSAELQAAHGAEEEEEQNSSTHSNGDSQVDGSPDAYAYLTQLSGILRAVFAHLCSLEHGDKFEKEHAVYLRKQLDVVHEYHHLRLGFSCELCSLLRSYMEDTLEAAMKSVQCGNFDAYLARTKTYHAKIFAGVEDYLEVGPHAELLRKREALIEHLMPGALVGLQNCIFSLVAPVHTARLFILGLLCTDSTPTKCSLSLPPHTCLQMTRVTCMQAPSCRAPHMSVCLSVNCCVGHALADL